MHQSDLDWYVANHPGSELAKLASGGAEFTNNHTSDSSDSDPGGTALMTGADPKATGIYYDDEHSHGVFPPGDDEVLRAGQGRQCDLRLPGRHPERRAGPPQQWHRQEVQLPAHEREQVSSNLRLHDTLDGEIDLVEQQLASRRSPARTVRRPMRIPGVGAITPLALVAVIGDITRFPSPRHLVGYLGLDPRVRQSGGNTARHGHICREGQAHARGLPVEAAHTAIRTPGSPLRAFRALLAPRRGKQIAMCATARKLTVLVWHLLSKDEDNGFGSEPVRLPDLHGRQRDRVRATLKDRLGFPMCGCSSFTATYCGARARTCTPQTSRRRWSVSGTRSMWSARSVTRQD